MHTPDNNAVYALKVAKDNAKETLQSIALESSKAQQWQALGIPHAKVLVQKQNYVLKVWINGISGEDVIKKYFDGNETSQAPAQKLLNLVSKIRRQGAYIGDFRPANMIWNGKSWIIIDSGSIMNGMTFEEADALWHQSDSRGPKFQRRWQLSPPTALMCHKLFLPK